MAAPIEAYTGWMPWIRARTILLARHPHIDRLRRGPRQTATIHQALNKCQVQHCQCPPKQRLAQWLPSTSIAQRLPTGGMQGAPRPAWRAVRALPTYKVDIAQDRREQPAENVAIAGRQDDSGRGGHRQTSKLWLMGGAQRQGAGHSVHACTMNIQAPKCI
jgi:hypothetical protein